MNKICPGCGVPLQNTNETELGYTPDLSNKYCKRCFRLKNYNEKNDNETVDENSIIARVNKQNGLVFFLIDFLNINRDTLSIFNKIKLNKILVVSKSDTFRREQKYDKIRTFLKNTYEITSPIIFLNNKSIKPSFNLLNYLDTYNTKKAFIMGITNAGKSTFLNKFCESHNINKEIITSDKPNTTLGFIKISFDGYTIFDTPGFNYPNLNTQIIKEKINLLNYQIKPNTTIVINDACSLYFKEANNIIIYTTHNAIKRHYKNTISSGFEIKIPKNSDFIIPGLGFVTIKNACLLVSSYQGEVRPSLLEVPNE